MIRVEIDTVWPIFFMFYEFELANKNSLNR